MCQKIAEARIWAARKLPYMRHQIMALLPVAKPGIGTMCVDEYSRMYYDPAFVEGRDLGHLGFVVAHEVIHVWGQHCKRNRKLLGDNPARDRLTIWRQAVDASVNDILEQTGLRCPQEGITPGKLDLPRNKTPEEYYNLLLERAAQQAEQQKQQQAQQEQDDQQASQEHGNDGEASDDATESQEQPNKEQDDGQADDSDQAGESQGEGDQGDQPGESDGCGVGDPEPCDQAGDGMGEGQDGTGQEGTASNQGGADGGPEETVSASEIGGSCMDGQQRPWEDGPPDAEHPGLAEYEQNIVEAAVAKEIENYQAQRGKGSVPGGLASKAADMLHPKVDPCKELAARIKYCVDSTGGFGTYTYQRPNRRQPMGGALLPAHRKPIPRVTVIVDTSGSMDKSDLDQALGVVGNALRSLPDPRGLRVLVGGTRVEAAKSIFRADQLELIEGGGTEMSVLLKAAAEERPTPRGIICVTDGETNWPRKPVGPRVVVALTRKPCCCAMPPAWMEVVTLNPED